MKSKLTRAELSAQAMLLDAWYDAYDHTFNPNDRKIIINPDGLGVWDRLAYLGQIFQPRRKRVEAGEIGAADGPFHVTEHLNDD